MFANSKAALIALQKLTTKVAKEIFAELKKKDKRPTKKAHQRKLAGQFFRWKWNDMSKITRKRNLSEPVMPWGRHACGPISNLTTNHLRWLDAKQLLDEKFKKAVREELARRGAS